MERGCFKLTRARRKYEKMIVERNNPYQFAQIALMPGSRTTVTKTGGLAGLVLAFLCTGMEAKCKMRQHVRRRKFFLKKKEVKSSCAQ